MDITAFPVAADEDAWPAAEALERYLASGAPADRVTISSDAGGCLPCFDADGRVCRMDVGPPARCWRRCAKRWRAALPSKRCCPPFTSNPAKLLRLARKGTIAVGHDADLVVLDANGAVHTVLVARRNPRAGRSTGPARHFRVTCSR